MAVYPGAIWRPLPENVTQSTIVPRAVILHTAVDSLNPNSSIHGFFARGDVVVESHFYVMNNGTIEQYMDTSRRADANGSANGFAISIETEDDGNPHQNPWTSAQIKSLTELIEWLCQIHRIPWRQIGSPTGSGIGWHSMWGVNTVTQPNINPWTTAKGKECPGRARIPQARVLSQGGVLVSGEADVVAKFMMDKMAALPDGNPFKGKHAGDMLLDAAGYGRAALLELQAFRAAAMAAIGALANAVQVGEANDLTEEKMRELLEEAVANAVIDVDVHIPSEQETNPTA
jgi:N-acetylmuramoyl-L-alanine amidase